MSQSYDKIGVGYSNQRKPDPRIGRDIQAALGESQSIVNVGAGSGAYEPTHTPTFAVEPSFQMIKQRRNKLNVIQASAEALPFKDAAVDSVLAVLTIHHWSDLARGLGECTRTSKRQVAILTWDPETPGFWLTQEYFPELLELDRRIFPSMDKLRHHLGSIEVAPVEVPADCIDGFLGAYWRRPEAYLRAEVRSGMSSFSRIENVPERLEQLRNDLTSGVWHRAHGRLQTRENCDLGYRLVTAVVH